MFVLKLPHFFTRLYGEGKRAPISKLTYSLIPSSRSYIVLALKILIFINISTISLNSLP